MKMLAVSSFQEEAEDKLDQRDDEAGSLDGAPPPPPCMGGVSQDMHIRAALSAATANGTNANSVLGQAIIKQVRAPPKPLLTVSNSLKRVNRFVKSIKEPMYSTL
eukprot:8672623-Pyramimonas_sp.AAC.1